MNILDRAIAAFYRNGFIKRATAGLSHMSVFFRGALRLLVAAIDLRDVITFSGLGAIFFGLAQMYLPAAWVVMGVALFWLGVRR